MGGRDPIGNPASTWQRYASQPRPSAHTGAHEERVRYSLRRAAVPASLCFVAGAAWGLHETLMHHNANFFRVFPGASRRFWGPDSWKNKYDAPWWMPVQLSDGKHLSATLHHVALFSAGVAITIGERRPAWHYAADAGIGLVAYTVGNWFTWDMLF